MSKRKSKIKKVKEPVFITDEFKEFDCKLRKEIATAKNAQATLEKNRIVLECIKALRVGFKLFVLNSWSGLLVVIGCKIKEMNDIQPVLELIEKHFKVSFDKSSDSADMGWRSFTCKQLPWLRVDAEIEDGSEKCKRVVVGYEQTPKYEIKCDEEIPQ